MRRNLPKFIKGTITPKQQIQWLKLLRETVLTEEKIKEIEDEQGSGNEIIDEALYLLYAETFDHVRNLYAKVDKKHDNEFAELVEELMLNEKLQKKMFKPLKIKK